MRKMSIIFIAGALVAGCSPLPRGGAYSDWADSPQDTISGVPIQWREVEPHRFQMILGRGELRNQKDAVANLSARLCPQGYELEFLGERGSAQWLEALVSCNVRG